MTVKTDQLCRTCRRQQLARETRAGLTWLTCANCDGAPYRAWTLHLLLDDGLTLCDEVRNEWDRYERASFDPWVLAQQTSDRDLCVGCADGWNAGIGEMDVDEDGPTIGGSE